MKIRIGDTVEVIKGEEIGKRGLVELTNKKFNIARVQGINLKTNYEMSLNDQREKIEDFLDASQLQLIDPILDKPTDIKFAYLEDGTRV